jgi:hypothetical protein
MYEYWKNNYSDTLLSLDYQCDNVKISVVVCPIVISFGTSDFLIFSLAKVFLIQ